MLRTRENSDVFNSRDEIYLVFTEKKQISSIYLRHEYVSNDTLIYSDHDDIVWIKIDKTLCSLDNDLFIGLCYVVPDNSSRQSMIETNIFDRLLTLCY